LDLLVSDDELKTRREACNCSAPKNFDFSRGYAKLFHESILQADQGCDFDFMVPGRARELE